MIKDLVGIYMPCFNVEKYIDESINSIKKQTFKNWELVIIDDCSTDGTYNRAIKHVSSNIKVFKREEHCAKIGMIKNECIAKLNNPEFLCHVGSDDLIPENCLEIFVNYMNKNPDIGACCGNFKCFNDEGHEWSFPHVANSGEFNSNILLRYMCLFPHRFYRKSVVDSVGGYSNELTSAVDYDLALKLDEITKIHRIKEPITYYYRQHSQQVSTRARPEQDLNAKTALQNALNRRKIEGYVANDAPPFLIQTNIKEVKEQDHFIWGKK